MFGLILSKRLNLSDQILLNMLNFKPSSDDQDISESSDEYEGVVAGDMEGLEDSDSDMSEYDDDKIKGISSLNAMNNHVDCENRTTRDGTDEEHDETTKATEKRASNSIAGPCDPGHVGFVHDDNAH